MLSESKPSASARAGAGRTIRSLPRATLLALPVPLVTRPPGSLVGPLDRAYTVRIGSRTMRTMYAAIRAIARSQTREGTVVHQANGPERRTKGSSMDIQRTGRLFGWFFIATFVTSIPARILFADALGVDFQSIRFIPGAGL